MKYGPDQRSTAKETAALLDKISIKYLLLCNDVNSMLPSSIGLALAYWLYHRF